MRKVKRRRKSKRNLIMPLILLLTFGVGIGNSMLTQSLTLGGTINIEPPSFDIGFISVSDVTEHGSVPSSTTISNDKQTLTISCNYGSPPDSTLCVVNATINNNSSSNYKLQSVDLKYEGLSIWQCPDLSDIDVYDDSYKAIIGRILNAGASVNMKILVYAHLVDGYLASGAQTIPLTVTLNWVEV